MHRLAAVLMRVGGAAAAGMHPRAVAQQQQRQQLPGGWAALMV
jgi:hypothetical protein